MTFWDFLDRRWPSDRAWVTILLAVLIGSLLKMADHDPTLWRVEIFKSILQAAVITGALNMVLAFHFAANKSDETKAENTGKAFDAITAAANASPAVPEPKADIELQPGETATIAAEPEDKP